MFERDSNEWCGRIHWEAIGQRLWEFLSFVNFEKIILKGHPLVSVFRKSSIAFLYKSPSGCHRNSEKIIFKHWNQSIWSFLDLKYNQFYLAF